MIIKVENELPIIPGRGLVTAASTKMRLEYLKENVISAQNLSDSNLELKKIQHNIESYIGTVEIPVGIVGPLKFIDEANEELVYTAAGTLEGALIASMNRGAKAVSLSGGFKASVAWQKMSRAPLFIFEKQVDANIFIAFLEANFTEIKKKAESYSNHAKLAAIFPVKIDNGVHAKFIYSTGDASGQNMTTTCTWHAMLFIAEKFTRETQINFVDFILEGNGSSDKKVSSWSAHSGRGVNVIAECFLPEHIINQVLRTSSDKMIRAFASSQKLARMDGMVGYNINVANAIAAIYVATGQDLACIHESSVGVLSLTPEADGLLVTLNLPNLVIGTVGGGTHLAKQSEALEIMNCKGNGKVERFAKLIAGFALGLELSTFAAIVSGEFAKAHEKLGRNKPVDWLLQSELTTSFLKSCLTHCKEEIISARVKANDLMENGILTHIAGRVSKKLIGFETVLLNVKKGNDILEREVVLKSKALDEEVIKGLHMIAASIDPELSNLIKANKNFLEYKNCHQKEVEVYEYLHQSGADFIPAFYGKHINPAREIHLIAIEMLNVADMHLMNSENSPEKWQKDKIIDVIRTAGKIHQCMNNGMNHALFKSAQVEFEPWRSNDLYNKMINLILKEETSIVHKEELKTLIDASLYLEQLSRGIKISKTIVHNDFNPRNIAIRKNGEPVIYDWELAVLNYPHRDIVEFLSFVLKPEFTRTELMNYLEYDFNCNAGNDVSRSDWFKVYEYAIIELIITRLVFYEVAGIVVKYEFSERVLGNALKMLNMVKQA